MRFYFFATSLLLLISLPGLAQASGSRTEKKVEWKSNDLNQGYALLYGIAKKQKSLDMVLLVKTAEQPTADLIREITKTYTDLYGYLEPLKINDQAVAKSKDELPLAETSSRARIERIKSEQLMSRSGSFFELSLLSTQTEALTYSSALLSHIAEQDPSPANKQKALVFQKKLEDLLKKTWRRIETL
jgi:hypothetical protein